MIIFDLDGTLANCEHRRHFVDPSYDINYLKSCCDEGKYCNIHTGEKFKPNWKAFYEACDKDMPINETIYILRQLAERQKEIQIWSGRCESVRDKTISWLDKHLGFDWFIDGKCPIVKMRPIGDSTPDDVLKESWLDEYLRLPSMDTASGIVNKIDFVFDDRPKVIRMWRRRGIFVFNCCQHDSEF